MKKYPHNEDAEMSLLSCILKDSDGSVYDEVLQIVSFDDFFIPKHQTIFKAFSDLIAVGKPIDELSLLELLRRQKVKEIGADYIAKVGDCSETSTQAVYLATVVKEKSKLRSLIRFTKQATEDAMNSDEPDALMSRLESQIIELGKNSCEDDTIAKATIEVEKDFAAMLEGTYEQHGLKTFVDELDNYLPSGLEPGTVTVISAPTSCGKSQLAINIAMKNAIANNIAIGYFSFEMPSKQLAKRMLWISSGVNAKYFRERTASEQQKLAVNEAAKKIKATVMLTNHNKRGVDELSSLARQWRRKHKIGLLVVDYLQLMSPFNSKASPVEAVAYNSRKLKALAMDLNIPLLVLSQVNREAVKRLEYSPQRGLFVHDLIGGSAIESDADNVLLFWPSAGEADKSRLTDSEGRLYMGLTAQFAKYREGNRATRFNLKFREQTGRF